MKKVRTNSGKVYDVYFRLKSENDETKEYSYYVYAVDEDHARQIVESYDADAVIYDTEEVSDAISQHYGLALNDYQHAAMTTCMDSSNNFAYMFYNLLGEVGELVAKVNERLQEIDLLETADELENYGMMAKTIRKEPDTYWVKTVVDSVTQAMASTAKEDTNIQKEAGDILWQLAGLCSVMGWSLEEVAQQNLYKLASRKERNVIDGNGDNR